MNSQACQEEILRAVHKGRYMVKEMIGVIQIKKYRAMRARYDKSSHNDEVNDQDEVIQQAMKHLERQKDS
jgi:hypothetical protein